MTAGRGETIAMTERGVFAAHYRIRCLCRHGFALHILGCQVHLPQKRSGRHIQNERPRNYQGRNNGYLLRYMLGENAYLGSILNQSNKLDLWNGQVSQATNQADCADCM